MKHKVIIIAICVALVITVSVIALVLALNDNPDVNTEPNTNTPNDGETTSPTDTDEPKTNYTVLFLNDDKSILKQVTVVSGEAPTSPGTPTMLQGYVFNGWDSDLSSVTKDMAVLPLREEIGNERNVISISNGYGVTGDTVSLPLSLCGKVDICCFELKITYDKSTLQFVDFSYEDVGITANCDAENGVIYLNYISTNNTTGQVDLCDVSFKLIGNTTKQVPLNITVELAVKVNDSDDYENVECDVRNGKIDLIGR